MDVDLGIMPLDHAVALRLALKHALATGAFWTGDTYTKAASVAAMLDFKIAVAEKEAAA